MPGFSLMRLQCQRASVESRSGAGVTKALKREKRRWFSGATRRLLGLFDPSAQSDYQRKTVDQLYYRLYFGKNPAVCAASPILLLFENSYPLRQVFQDGGNRPRRKPTP